MTNKVTYESRDSIGTITLNNPEKSNPLSLAVLRQLIDYFRKSASNGDLCVIYRAEGKNFTFGADLKEAYEMLTDPDQKAKAAENVWAYQELTTAMLEHPGPIIVGYHGWIVGGGFEHTLGCDLRIAADNTKIMLPELEVGIFFSNASTKILPRIIGEGRAKELMLLGDVVKADRALEIGLVNRVCAPEELDSLLGEYAQKLAGKAPLALKTAKRQINESQEFSIDHALYKEGRAMIDTGQSDEAKKRIGAFFKK
ncbi:MAG: enoyl-CoA hydratase/isomerase family protein [Desulfobacterales bacterium]|nr:enoyl-CoA hydratase/isomerase family protein [Desulfobacterales bacterium]